MRQRITMEKIKTWIAVFIILAITIPMVIYGLKEMDRLMGSLEIDDRDF